MSDVTNATFRPVRPMINLVLLQTALLVAEAAVVANGNTLTYTLPAGDRLLPPLSANVFTHDGGIENGSTANWAIDSGDTLQFEAWNPDASDGVRAHPNGDNQQVTTEFEVSLNDLTDGAATAAEVVAALMADATFTEFAYAVASVVTANRVMIFPKGLKSKIRVIGGTAQSVLLFPAGYADNTERVYTRVGLDAGAWDMTYDGGTGVITLTNNTGGTVKRVIGYMSLV